MAGESERLDPLLSTAEIIEEARRPLLINRHKAMIEEMEQSLSDALVTGEADNPRLKTLLAELESDSEQQRIKNTLGELAEDEHYAHATLRNAMVEHLALLREERQIEVASLQLHAIGVYRAVRKQMSDRQCLVPSLADLRELPAAKLTRLQRPMDARFGDVNLAAALVYAPTQAASALADLRKLRKPDDADTEWIEAAGAPALARELEEPLESLPEAQRIAARQRLIADRIRSRYYKGIFLTYLGRDNLDPKEVAAHRTILHWLQSISETPHLYPFMQGQTPQQKRFRLAHLSVKIIQMNEMYQRVARAAEHPTYRERFGSLDTRGKLDVLAKERYPALTVDHDFMAATVLCPFASFAAWVQDKVETKDFVLPPEPKGK